MNVILWNYNKTGSSVLTPVEHEESAFVSASAPVASVRSDSTTKENEHQVEFSEGNTQFKKQNIRRRVKTVLSPGSASSVRQSPRLKVRINHQLYFLI